MLLDTRKGLLTLKPAYSKRCVVITIMIALKVFQLWTCKESFQKKLCKSPLVFSEADTIAYMIICITEHTAQHIGSAVAVRGL